MTQRKYLTASEVSLMIEQAASSSFPERNACLIYLGFIHGFRVSELCHLRLADLSLSERSVYIRRMKNGFSTIHPVIPAELRMLRAWLRVRRTLPAADCEWLFISRQGKALSRQRIWQIMQMLGKKAGIPVSTHPHMLRHACGFALADRGIDTRLIQDYLGHRNIRHTVRYTASNAERFLNIWSERNRKVNS